MWRVHVPTRDELGLAASQPRECLVLALAEGSVRLIDVPADLPPTAVHVPDLPTSAADEDGKASIGDRSHSGRLVGSEGKRAHIRSYARAVDATLRPTATGSGLPLVLVTAEPGPVVAVLRFAG
jgi:hypothetical protein